MDGLGALLLFHLCFFHFPIRRYLGKLDSGKRNDAAVEMQSELLLVGI